METAVLKCCDTLRHSATLCDRCRRDRKFSISATLCDTLRSMETPVLIFRDWLRSENNRLMRFHSSCGHVMLLSLKHGAKILQHSATNGDIVSQGVTKCSKPNFCDTLRHFATLCDFMETRLKTEAGYQIDVQRIVINYIHCLKIHAAIPTSHLIFGSLLLHALVRSTKKKI